jgi:hypothetical protein
MAVSTNSTDPAIPPVGASRAESLKARDEAVVKALVGASSVLLLMAMFIVGVGTLAQVDKDIWEVVDDYFRSWICWVQWKVFFPPVFFPSLARFDWDSLPIGGFPFPGGAAIGAALFVLLAAAQAFCFKIQARGSRLAAGLAVLAAGALIAWLVIEAGHNKHGVQGAPFFRWGGVWHIIQLLLVGACLIAVYALCRIDRKRKLEMGILGIAVLGLGGLAVWNFCAPLNDASMRILW